jgi:ketosteroid isomerase-like protein
MSKAAPLINDPTGAEIEDARSEDERALRELLDRWVTAIRNHDLAAIEKDRTKDIVMFDVPEPLQLKGMEQYLDSWRLYFQFDGSKTFQLQELKVSIGSDIAWAHAILRCEGVPEATARLTVGFIKQDGAWKVAHEHHSGPMTVDR